MDKPMRLLHISTVLLAATLGLATAARSTSGKDGNSFPPPEEPGGKFSREAATERLQRTQEKAAQLRTLPGAQSTPEAAPRLQLMQNLLANAQTALTAGNYPLVFSLCDQTERVAAESYALMNRKSFQRGPSPMTGMGGDDSLRNRQDQKLAAEANIQRLSERIAFYSQRLETGKNPRAGELMDKIRGLLDGARQQVAAGRPLAAAPYLSQAETLFPELQRLIQEFANLDKQNISGSSRDPYKDRQPGAQAALGQANERYRRLSNSFVRLSEQAGQPDDARTVSLRTHIQELLDKTKEALATGKADAANEYCVKVEGLLTDLHRSLSATGNRLSPATWDRLKAKLERASEIVSASGNGKAAKILEKGREHFDRAERSHAEGQATRAELEMDLALKLAAKAVDIARSESR
jgi:hypothetical protein